MPRSSIWTRGGEITCVADNPRGPHSQPHTLQRIGNGAARSCSLDINEDEEQTGMVAVSGGYRKQLL